MPRPQKPPPTSPHPSPRRWLLALMLLALTTTAACADQLSPGGEPMTVELVAPERVQQGQLVTLLGRFPSAPSHTRAWVSGVCTTVAGWSSEEVVVLVPRGAGVGDRVVVLLADGAYSNAVRVEVVGPDFPADRIYCDEGTGD